MVFLILILKDSCSKFQVLSPFWCQCMKNATNYKKYKTSLELSVVLYLNAALAIEILISYSYSL